MLHQYDDFLSKVCEGRGISKDVIEELAGGRVYTGLTALLKSRPEEELVEETTSQEGGAAKDKPAKISFRYRPKDITRNGEFSTIFIEGENEGEEPARGSSSPSAAQQETQEADIVAQAAKLVAEEEGSIAVAATSGGDEVIGESEEKLAQKAHQVATNDHEAAESIQTPAAELAAEVPKGPYGRGLIDTIGGLGEAAALAFATEVS